MTPHQLHVFSGKYIAIAAAEASMLHTTKHEAARYNFLLYMRQSNQACVSAT